MPSNVNNISTVKTTNGTVYNVSPSSSGTLTGFSSGDSSSPSEFSTVSTIDPSSDTNGTIFTKVTTMIKNARYLYNKLGSTSIPSTLGTTVTSAISSLNTALSGKADSSHNHTVSDLPISSVQVNSNDYIPTSGLIYNMNSELTGRVSAGSEFTTNVDCGGISSGTEIKSTYAIQDIMYNMLKGSPPVPTEYESVNIGTWNSASDVDAFFTTYTPFNGWKGLKLGNYITINDGTYNVDWEIAGFNCEHNATAADGTVYDNGYGLCMIPKKQVTTGKWNTTETLVGGYASSNIHNAVLNNDVSGSVYNNMKTILGNHIVNRDVLLSSACEGTSPRSEVSSAYTWTTAYFTLMSIGQMNGTFASYWNKYDDGEANYKLPVFDHEAFKTGAYFWSRCVYGLDVSRRCAWFVNVTGSITRFSVTSSYGVRPLMYLR